MRHGGNLSPHNTRPSDFSRFGSRRIFCEYAGSVGALWDPILRSFNVLRLHDGTCSNSQLHDGKVDYLWQYRIVRLECVEKLADILLLISALTNQATRAVVHAGVNSKADPKLEFVQRQEDDRRHGAEVRLTFM